MQRWIEKVGRLAGEAAGLTVVCRTAATVRAVYRELARTPASSGAFPGLQVTTLRGLLASVGPRSLFEEAEHALEPIPEGHPWAARLAVRPELTRELRRRLVRVYEHRAVGGELKGFSSEVRALIEAGWAAPSHLAQAQRLLKLSSTGRTPVLAVGFGEGTFSFLGSHGRFERALLEALGAEYIDVDSPQAAPKLELTALRVPDVAAEARACVARGGGNGVLVLVPETATEERIRAAFQRNGWAVSDDAASPLFRHSLASVLLPFLPAFHSRGTEPVAVTELVRFLSDPVLTRRPPAGVELPALAEDPEPRLTLRHVRELLASARRTRGSLAEWVETMEGIEAELERTYAPEANDSGAARRLSSIRVLRSKLACLQLHATRGEGKLGGLAKAITTIGLSSPGSDRLGEGILQALEANRHRAAIQEEYEDALSGAVGSRRVGLGVEILTYAEYDGRPCETLLLTGVHDKGLARSPSPDPFFTAEEFRQLGTPTGSEAVRERLALLHWAQSRAKSTLAIVTDTDATGRRVTPPIELELRFDDVLRQASYGLTLPLPETEDLTALATGGEVDGWGTQVDAEWARDGALFEALPPGGELSEAESTLAEILQQEQARLPEALRPWLGTVGAILPDGNSPLPPSATISAKRVESLTQCLYRSFLDTVVRLKAPEEFEEDLDSREVGNAVHRAIQFAAEGTYLRVPERNLSEARAALLEKLQAQTEQQIAEEARQRPLGTESEALELARRGLTERWKRHWEAYVHDRVRGIETENAAAVTRAFKQESFGEALEGVAEVLGPGLAKGPLAQLTKNLRDTLARHSADAAAVLNDAEGMVTKLAAKNVPIVHAALASAEGKTRVQSLCSTVAGELANTRFHPEGDLELVDRELEFGFDAPLSLELGSAAIGVRGSIDAVVRHRGPEDRAHRYQVIDFKTGALPGDQDAVLSRFTRPQLPFYALALQKLVEQREGAADVEITSVGYDAVKSEQKLFPVNEAVLARGESLFGAVLDKARAGDFPALPHPKGCPVLQQRGAYCDFAEVCRVRQGIGTLHSQPVAEEVPE